MSHSGRVRSGPVDAIPEAVFAVPGNNSKGHVLTPVLQVGFSAASQAAAPRDSFGIRSARGGTGYRRSDVGPDRATEIGRANPLARHHLRWPTFEQETAEVE